MSNFRFGAQMYTVRNLCQTPEDFRETTRKVSALGYKGMQLSGQCAMDPHYVRACCDEAGLEIVCTHIGFDDMLADPQGVIENHRVYGCAYPGIGGLPGRYYEAGIDSLRVFIREASDIAKRFADAGMHFIYHNHAHEFQRIDGKTVLEILFAESAPEFQLELDTYWVQCGGGNPVKWIEHAKGRADIVHFKDMIGTKANAPRITTVGKGNLDWPEIIAACDRTGVKWALIEQDNAVEEDGIACLAYAHTFLTGLGCRV